VEPKPVAATTIPFVGYRRNKILGILGGYSWGKSTAPIADYAAGEYYVVGFMLVLPLVILSPLADIVLAGVMIWLKTFCLLARYSKPLLIES